VVRERAQLILCLRRTGSHIGQYLTNLTPNGPDSDHFRRHIDTVCTDKVYGLHGYFAQKYSVATDDNNTIFKWTVGVPFP
jgi:hypothetical protein